MEMSNFGYGYKLKLSLVNPYGNNSANGTPQNLERMVFVPAQKIWIRIIKRITTEDGSTEEVINNKMVNAFLWEEPNIESGTNENEIIIQWNDGSDSDTYIIENGQQVFKQYCYSKIEPNENTIWSNEPVHCGEYQVPAGVKISDLTLYDNSQATIDYKAHFNLNYSNNNNIPQYCEVTEQVSGCITDTWEKGQNIAPLLKNKYYSYIEENDIIYKYSLDSWYNMTFNGIENFINVSISTTDDSILQNYKLDNKGLFYEIEEDSEIKRIYLNPNLQIDQCIIQEENGVTGSINYKAYIVKRTYI